MVDQNKSQDRHILDAYIDSPPSFEDSDFAPRCVDYNICEATKRLVFVEEQRDPIKHAFDRAVSAGIEAGVFSKASTEDGFQPSEPRFNHLFNQVRRAQKTSTVETYLNVIDTFLGDKMITAPDAAKTAAKAKQLLDDSCFPHDPFHKIHSKILSNALKEKATRIQHSLI